MPGMPELVINTLCYLAAFGVGVIVTALMVPTPEERFLNTGYLTRSRVNEVRAHLNHLDRLAGLSDSKSDTRSSFREVYVFLNTLERSVPSDDELKPNGSPA